MSSVTGSGPMSMASLYAMLGLAMPSGAAASGSVGAAPALAMISASSGSAAAEVATLTPGMGGSPAASAARDLTSALLSLANLDPTVELQRLAAVVADDLETVEEANRNG